MGLPSGAGPGGASALSSVFTLMNSAVGAGVLSLPFAFRCAGWAGGILATFCVAAIESFTLYVLARYAEVTGSTTYSDLVRKFLGKKASAAMSVVLIIYSYGSATAYLIILGDCFQPMLEQGFGQVWWTERNLVILVLASAFMLPLCFPQTLDAISAFSSVTFYALCCVVGAVMYRAVQAVQAHGYDWSHVHAFRPPLSVLDALPILAFGFQCHTNLVAVFDELEEEPELFGSASNILGLGGASEADASSAEAPPPADDASAVDGPGTGVGCAGKEEATGGAPEQTGSGAVVAPPPEERVLLLRRPLRHFTQPVRPSPKLLGMVRVVSAAICLSGIFYTLVGLFGYVTFPTDVMSNLMLNYPVNDRLMQVARGLVGVIQIVHYPINHFPARNATHDLLSQLTGRQLTGQLFNVVEVLAFFIFSLALSLLVTDLGQVFKLIGGSCGAFFIFAIPGALLLQYAYNKHLDVRDGELQQSLLEAGAGEGQPQGQGAAGTAPGAAAGAAAAAPAGYHYLASKLWWAGIALQLMAVALLALTVYTLLAPPV